MSGWNLVYWSYSYPILQSLTDISVQDTIVEPIQFKLSSFKKYTNLQLLQQHIQQYIHWQIQQLSDFQTIARDGCRRN